MKNKRIIKFFIIISLLVTYSKVVAMEVSAQQTFEKAAAIYDDPDTENSLTRATLNAVFLKLSNKGHACSNYYLGRYKSRYDYGSGLEHDKKIFEFYSKAYNLGCKVSAFELGSAYEKGRGVDANPSFAEKLYLEAAESELSSYTAPLHVARSYITGTSVFERNLPAAYLWLNKAAEKGSLEAKQNLKSCNYNGLFCEKHLNQDFTTSSLNHKKVQATPSFDCKKATTAIEKSICSSEHLSELDVMMATSYKIFITNLPLENVSYARNIQHLFINDRHLQCRGDQLVNCIREGYYFWLNSIKKGVLTAKVSMRNSGVIQSPFDKSSSYRYEVTKTERQDMDYDVRETHKLYVNKESKSVAIFKGRVNKFGMSDIDKSIISHIIFYLTNNGKRHQAFQKNFISRGGRCNAYFNESLRFVSLENPEKKVADVNLIEIDSACDTFKKELYKWSVSDTDNIIFYQLEAETFYAQIPFIEIKAIEVNSEDSSVKEYYWIDKTHDKFLNVSYDKIIKDVSTRITQPPVGKEEHHVCSVDDYTFNDYYKFKGILSDYKLGFNQIEFFSKFKLKAEMLEMAVKYKPYLDASLLYLNKIRSVEHWQTKLTSAANKFPHIQATANYYYSGDTGSVAKPFSDAGFYSDEGCFSNKPSLWEHATLEEWFYLFWARRLGDETLERTENLLKVISGMLKLVEVEEPKPSNVSTKSKSSDPSIEVENDESTPNLGNFVKSINPVAIGNYNDLDNNSVPDYAQFNYPIEFSEQTNTFQCKCIEFASFSVTIPDEHIIPSARLMLFYSASDPAELVYLGEDVVLPNGGIQRVWLKGAEQKRNKLDVDLKGDFVASEKAYSFEELGITKDNPTVIFYQEMVIHYADELGVGLKYFDSADSEDNKN